MIVRNKRLFDQVLSVMAALVVLLGVMVVLSGALIPQGVHADAISATTTEPIISDLVVTPSTTTAMVQWSTDQAATSQLQWGLDTNYNASTTLDSALVTNHSQTILGLSPNTTYHFQILAANATSSATSTIMSFDQTFTTLGTTTATSTGSGATTTAPMVSSIMVTPTDTTANIQWMTDQAASSQIQWGTTQNYNASTTLDSGLVTSHSQILMGLLPNTTYHFQVWSVNGMGTATSTDQTFTTLMSTTTSGGGTSTSTDAIITALMGLQGTFPSFSGLIQGLINQIQAGNTVGNPPGGASIDQNGQTFQHGGSIDFVGRNFGHEETVKIMLNGTQIASAHADGGGNFSTGSMTLPNTAGTYTYTFTGSLSGMSTSATVHVI